MKTIENLAFKGGGTLGEAYVGVYKALQEVRLLGNDLKDFPAKTPPGDFKNTAVYGNVKRVAGTSAGSIFATVVALGLNYEQTAEVMDGVDFLTFVDFDPNFIEDGGLLLGEAFLDWMTTFVNEQFGVLIGKNNPTFGDLAKAIADPKYPPLLFKDLHVFSHRIDPNRTVEFSAQNTPDVPIAEAVRASMSIPFIFVPWQFPDPLAKQYPGPYFDGGCAFNYPVSAFDSGAADMKTLGIFLAQMSYTMQDTIALLVHTAMKLLKLDDYVSSIVEAVFEWAAQRDYKFGPVEPANLINSNLFAINDAAANANLSTANNIVTAAIKTRDKLKSGRKPAAAVDEFFKTLGLPDNNAVEYLKQASSWVNAVAATQNTPSNMVFDRDASRSIFVNTLGYIFYDFCLPECCKTKLVESGYNCTREYLSLIMYS